MLLLHSCYQVCEGSEDEDQHNDETYALEEDVDMGSSGSMEEGNEDIERRSTAGFERSQRDRRALNAESPKVSCIF